MSRWTAWLFCLVALGAARPATAEKPACGGERVDLARYVRETNPCSRPYSAGAHFITAADKALLAVSIAFTPRRVRPGRWARFVLTFENTASHPITLPFRTQCGRLLFPLRRVNRDPGALLTSGSEPLIRRDRSVDRCTPKRSRYGKTVFLTLPPGGRASYEGTLRAAYMADRGFREVGRMRVRRPRRLTRLRRGKHSLVLDPGLTISGPWGRGTRRMHRRYAWYATLPDALTVK